MRSFCFILVSSALLFVSCNKKEKSPEPTPVTPEVVVPDTGAKCQDLPPTPVPFGWQDVFPDPNESVNAFLFDPVNPDKLIYVVNGDQFGYNKLYFHDIPTQKSTYICALGEFLPQVNKNGWITFSDVDNNIVLIKNNADTIVKLTSDKHHKDPKWDFTGNFIYYYTEPYDQYESKLVKINTEGEVKAIMPVELPYAAPFKKSNHLIIFKTEGSTCHLIQREFDAPENDRNLISGPLYSKPGQINFDNLVLDKNDENFYWSNSNGIFRCNVASLKIDTILKNCQNFLYDNPIISFKPDELTYIHVILKPLKQDRLYHQYRAMEMNLLNRESFEVKIFP